jgi:hypothetical protein
MGRIFILVIILLLQIAKLQTQNLLLNGDFEDVILNVGNYHLKMDSFYARNWSIPTDCTPDIYRDYNVCDNLHIKSYEPQLNFCLHVISGNYCAGLCLIEFHGYVEHLTGKLKEPLKKDSLYKIRFWLKYIGGNDPRASMGFGFKFSNTQIVFQSAIKGDYGLVSNYLDLFQNCKIYPDYVMNNIFTDTTWTKFEGIFVAKGGEKYVTFGMFGFKNDKDIIDQFKLFNSNPNMKKLQSFLDEDKSILIKKVKSFKNQNLPELDNYYFLDNIDVLSLSEKERIIANSRCKNCIDNDPLTIFIPNSLEFKVDNGFTGDFEITINARLQIYETLIIELDNNNKVFIFNDLENKFKEFNFNFKYPAKKLRKKTIKYFIANKSQMQNLESYYFKSTYITPEFTGTLYTNIENLIQKNR